MSTSNSSLGVFKVSVCIITYNQEDYIGQAIEGVLMQETSFPIELLIGEDCSTDHTREIISNYHKQHPDKIHLILQEHNVGPIANFVSVYNKCRGDYIALCEGDDYWTNPTKLQKQVDFLDSHPEFAICFHNVLAFYQDNNYPSFLLCKQNQKRITTIKDLLSSWFIPTVSVLFRRGLIFNFPDWFINSKLGDWPLHIMNAHFGKIGYINSVMASYRIHEKNWTNTTDEIVVRNSIIDMFNHIDAYYGYKYSSMINMTVNRIYLDIGRLYAHRNDIINAKFYLTKCMRNFSIQTRGKIYLLALFCHVYFPKLYWLSRSIFLKLGLLRKINTIRINPT